ncbi:MAG: ethyl tert-butyl ether degradation protein EthD [Betaproteobacteria bacterium]|nr:ethyl tert-butyl ether degradation protein EthD [Betaproteobacteria bacterium]MBL8535645.1 ethyl tert-butyl ether degradation protein EthD [Betaproteobacteria bacterium]
MNTLPSAAPAAACICWFALFRRHGSEGTTLDAAESRRLAGALEGSVGMILALEHCAQVPEEFPGEETPLWLVLQCYFATLPALEQSLASGGALASLSDPAAFPSLAQAEASEQAMEVLPFPIPEAPPGPKSACCTYLVGFEGPAQDSDTWLSYYLSTQATQLTQLPRVREVEVYTPLQWRSALPWKRASHLQRNKAVFDDPKSLVGALHSPVRHRMRHDLSRFPPFSGRVTHHPMHTRELYRAS